MRIYRVEKEYRHIELVDVEADTKEEAEKIACEQDRTGNHCGGVYSCRVTLRPKTKQETP